MRPLFPNAGSASDTCICTCMCTYVHAEDCIRVLYIELYAFVSSQAMVMFHGKEKFSRDLLEILNKLATDDNVKVRQSIAYGIHEVCLLAYQ